MEFEVVRDKLMESVQQVVNDDAHLLLNDISERAISHRLGVYLIPHFEGFDVDCEYNGNVNADRGRKYIILLKDRARALGLEEIDGNGEETTSRAVYPDIIVLSAEGMGQKTTSSS